MNTWGISGGAFLAGYIALIGAAWLLVRELRTRTLRDRGDAGPEPSLDVYEIAIANDGPRLAIAAAAARLCDAGALAVDASGALTIAGPLPSGAHPLERRLYADVGDGIRRSDRDLRDDWAIEAMHARLTNLGLVPTRLQALRVRIHAIWLIPVVLLGLARVGAGEANGKPVGFILALTGVAAVVAFVLASDVPRVTQRGEQLLARLRSEDPTLVSTPLAASVALSGATALWSADAGLAAAVGLPRESGVGGAGGGGGCGGGGGGCGG